jgi:hypothetical protein
MKKPFSFGLLLLFLFFCMGCNASSGNVHTEPGKLYEIRKTSVENAGNIYYPELVSTSIDTNQINASIKEALLAYLKENVADYGQDAVVSLDFSTPSHNGTLLCVLFEGTVVYPSAAHPTNLAFSVCVRIADGASICPTTLFQMDNDFFAAFRERLAVNPAPDQYDAVQWEQIAAYIGAYTNGDIEMLLNANPQGTLAIAEEGVTVLFPVPHAIGDYIKIPVSTDR